MQHRKAVPKIKKLSTGLFITFEGPEGSGKTTQCKKLARTLREYGYRVLITREPGGTPLAENIRGLLLTQPNSRAAQESISPGCETLLILAARAQHVAHVIEPALALGTIVLCDRFFDSTLAYQGYGRKIPIPTMKTVNRFATNGLQPHLTFLLDLPIVKGLARRQRSNYQNRIDKESITFHESVRKGFLRLAKQHPDRIHTMDALQTPKTLAEGIEAITLNHLKKKTSPSSSPSAQRAKKR